MDLSVPFGLMLKMVSVPVAWMGLLDLAASCAAVRKAARLLVNHSRNDGEGQNARVELIG